MRMLSALLLLFLCFSPAVADGSGETQPMFIVHFATGPAWDPERPPGEQTAFAEHSANLGKLRKEGAIAFGGRYGDLGMIILRAASREAAESLMAADPGVAAGIFTFELEPISVFYPWRE